MRRTIVTESLVLTILLLLAACGEDKSPNGPGGGEQGTITLTGVIMQGGYLMSSAAYIRITSAAVDTVVRYANMVYTLSDIPGGTYTVEPVELGNPTFVAVPASRTVTATSGLVEVEPFFCFTLDTKSSYEENELGVIGGRISCPDILRDKFRLTMTTTGGDTIETKQEWMNGYYGFLNIPHGTYRLTPTLDNFEFVPPYQTITVDGLCTFATFSAEYTGPALHTISCRILSDVQGYTASMIVTQGRLNSFSQSDEEGYAVTKLLPPGEYTVQISCSVPGTIDNSFERVIMNVTVADEDIDLGEFSIHYIGPMYYKVSGTVTDAAGNGIEGVTVTLQNYPRPPDFIPDSNIMTTNETGNYTTLYGARFYTREDIDMTVSATKPGWSIDPPSVALIHEYDRTLTLVEFTADFTAIPVVMGDFFPLAPGASWTYAHTADGVPSGTLTAEAGASFTAGGETWVPLSGYMFDSFAGYRVDGATMFAWTGQQAKTWATLDESSWDIGTIGGHSAHGERLESEVVTVPAGTFADCRVIRIAVPPDSPSAEVTTYWLAEGVGPVKVEFTATSGGMVVQRITDELVAYQAP